MSKMSRVCPKPCSRLATSAVFIAVGVVQFLVGIILLRSKYADLLSGPNFMTASTNIGVGCVFGITASIWKNSRKRASRKYTARKNVLASLLVSVITVNVTSAIVLIKGEGNQHLALHLGSSVRNGSVAFANEVLAGAYITSVCSPIVCIVVAIVALSGNWFQLYDGGNKSKETSVLKAKISCNWISDAESQSRPNLISDHVEMSASSSDLSSTSSEDSVFSEKSPLKSIPRKSILSNKIIQSPLKTWEQKRENALRESHSQQRAFTFDNCLQNPGFSYVSNMGATPHTKNSSSKKQRSANAKKTTSLSRYHKNGGTSEVELCNKASELSIDETDFKSPESGQDTLSFARNKYKRSKYYEKSGLNESSKLDQDAIVMLQHEARSSKHKRKSNPSSVVDITNSEFSVCVESDRHFSDSAVMHQKTDLTEDHAVAKLKMQTLKELKERVKRFSPRELKSIDGNKNNSNSLLKNRDQEETEVTEEELESIPVACHVSEGRNSFNDVFEDVPATNLMVTNSKKFVRIRNDQNITELPCSPFSGPRSPKPLTFDKNKITSAKLLNKKNPTTMRMSSMESIAEMPAEEMSENITCYKQSSVLTSDGNCLSESPRKTDENSNITHNIKTPARGKSSEFFISCRKSSRSMSPKNLIKKVWSSSGSEIKLDLSDMIVDEDSLIGLSEEELMARTSRIRSLRKIVEQRSKTGMKTESLKNVIEE